MSDAGGSSVVASTVFGQEKEALPRTWGRQLFEVRLSDDTGTFTVWASSFAKTLVVLAASIRYAGCQVCSVEPASVTSDTR